MSNKILVGIVFVLLLGLVVGVMVYNHNNQVNAERLQADLELQNKTLEQTQVAVEELNNEPTDAERRALLDSVNNYLNVLQNTTQNIEDNPVVRRGGGGGGSPSPNTGY